MTEKEFQDEVLALIDYLENRGFNGAESVAVMGATVTAMITDTETANNFLHMLRGNLKARIKSHHNKAH